MLAFLDNLEREKIARGILHFVAVTGDSNRDGIIGKLRDGWRHIKLLFLIFYVDRNQKFIKINSNSKSTSAGFSIILCEL
jgi:hypothetical protein